MLDGLSKAFCFIFILLVPLISSLQKKMHAFMMWGAGVYIWKPENNSQELNSCLPSYGLGE